MGIVDNARQVDWDDSLAWCQEGTARRDLSEEMTAVRRTMVAVAGVAAASAAVRSAPTSAAAASSVITALPVPEGTNFSRVNGVDPTGRFLAGFVGSDTVGQAAVWHEGALTLLSVPLDSPRAGAVNAAGVVVGTGFVAGSGSSQAWRVADGHYLELAVPEGGTESSAVGINADGDILLGFLDTNGTGQVAVRSGRTGALRTLSLPAGYSAIPAGISDDGTVTARASALDGAGPDRSFVWNAHGVRRELPGTAAGASVDVRASAGRWATGFQFDPAAGTVSQLRWDLRRRSARPLPADLDVAEAVNDLGTVGGQAGVDAALVSDGQLQRLPGLTATSIGDVAALSSAGVAGGTNFDAGLTQAVSWTCS